MRLVGLCTVAATVAALSATGGCSSSSDGARSSGGSAGTGTAGGGTAGSGNPTAGSSGSGTSGTGAGTSGSAGTAGTGTAGTAGASTCAETNTTDMCDTSATAPSLYDGVTTAPTCGSTIKMLPGAASPNTYWFNYGDATTGAMRTARGEKCGCAGANDCAFHAFGSGYADYGAGIGFDLNEDTANNNAALPFDATAYSGVRLWARGTTSGTRGKDYAAVANTIHIKLVTATERHGDDYGMYCTLPSATDWFECDVPFNMAYRDGFCTSTSTNPCTDKASDTLDKNQLLKIQVEFSEHQAAGDGGPVKDTVNFDVWVDDISIY